ncbi:N-6 DNA methylase [Nocardiopsis sp. RSe5-2]|uniref:site-specific DNA-methyltransferase (adenine-specific) n=1 Tax=Nocardiopsis endophytica TaxID=3018445 RepID=A0ABT4U126_9ACTN|nr:type ISP restriction/modification enzyme [Nocardiopsis endophytica]MDA2810648.1 N-6 DNA methylase [Nocardiopsis endophytica]
MTALPSDPSPDHGPHLPVGGYAARRLEAFIDEVKRSSNRGGWKEEQLRSPLKILIQDLSKDMGIPVTVFGEIPVKGLGARPDFGVDTADTGRSPINRIGYVELKKPNHPIPPSEYVQGHDLQQWENLRSLPNLLYSNGTEWSLFRYGIQRGRTTETPPLFSTKQKRIPPQREFETLLWDFLTWAPEQSYTLDQLITRVAHMCRQLRGEIIDLIEEERYSDGLKPFTGLARDWKTILFPTMKPGPDFADAYAQTVTFSLLVARESGVDFTDKTAREIGEQLGKHHRFLGEAFSTLVSSEEVEKKTILPTVIRILQPLDWNTVMQGEEHLYTDLYEVFLSRYDLELRKKSGSYYTPDPVASYMAEFVDSVLKKKMGVRTGFAHRSVTTIDPAMGTGTFLAAVTRRAATTLLDEVGPVQTRHRLREMYESRLIGFESSAAPFAVAELRLHQQLQDVYGVEVPKEHRRFLVNTLDDPGLAVPAYGLRYEEILDFRRRANETKCTTRIQVALGNPPYLAQAHQRAPAPWISKRRTDPVTDPIDSRPSLDEFREPGMGRIDNKLHHTAIYFWRWATWKLFDAHPDDPAGIIALVSTSAFLTGNVFAGMRRYLRATADEGWIVDLSPEGHQAPGPTRVFPGVQHPICIAVFVRYGEPRPDRPAKVWYTALEGLKEQKFTALSSDASLSVDGDAFALTQNGATAPFLPTSSSAVAWSSFPAFANLFPWHAPGVKANRTWVIAPERSTLLQRWRKLKSARPDTMDHLFKATDDRTTLKGVENLPAIADDHLEPVITKFAHRAFDRQFIVNDPRFVDRIRPALWKCVGLQQVYAVEQHSLQVSSGPGLLFTFCPPDQHYFNNRGGRVLPLHRDRAGRVPNTPPRLLSALESRLGITVTVEDLMAYCAGVVAHPGFVARFQEELKVPGIRIPLSADPDLWQAAVESGRQIIWLHTYGERFCDPDADRPRGAPRLPRGRRPQLVAEISDGKGGLPDRIWHDSDTGDAGDRLHVGEGAIAPVSPRAWHYDVNGMQVVKKWFSSRQRNPRGKRKGTPLDDIRPDRWSADYTDELVDLLSVLTLLVDLEPQQERLLDDIMDGQLITVGELTAAHALLPDEWNRKRPPSDEQLSFPAE